MLRRWPLGIRNLLSLVRLVDLCQLREWCGCTDGEDRVMVAEQGDPGGPL